MADFLSSSADYFGAGKDLLGGVSAFLGGNAEAKTATNAAQTYAQAARLSAASTQLKEAATARGVYQTLGSMRAATGANGLAMGGSAEDLIRDSAHQGAIAKAVVGLQGQIDYNSFMAQSASEAAKAASAKSGGTMGALGGIIGAIGSIFSSDDLLKEDVELLRRRPDGIGVYKFRYTGSQQFFEGAMASDVEKVMPEAIFYDEVGMRMVDYDQIKLQFRAV